MYVYYFVFVIHAIPDCSTNNIFVRLLFFPSCFPCWFSSKQNPKSHRKFATVFLFPISVHRNSGNNNFSDTLQCCWKIKLLANVDLISTFFAQILQFQLLFFFPNLIERTFLLTIKNYWYIEVAMCKLFTLVRTKQTTKCNSRTNDVVAEDWITVISFETFCHFIVH